MIPMLSKGYISRFINKAVRNNKIASEVLAITTTNFLETVSASFPPKIEPRGKIITGIELNNPTKNIESVFSNTYQPTNIILKKKHE